MTIGEHLLHVAEAGLAMSDVTVDEYFYNHLTVLLSIEDALDLGRTSLAISGSGEEYREEITRRMDQLRRKIRSLIDQCDTYEFRAFMEARGERLKTQFTK